MNVKKCNSLEEVRAEIDGVDKEIVQLIAKRNSYIHQAAKFKVSAEEVKDASRVASVISRARAEALELNLNPNMIQTLFEIMIEEMVEVEIAQFQNAKDL